MKSKSRCTECGLYDKGEGVLQNIESTGELITGFAKERTLYTQSKSPADFTAKLPGIYFFDNRQIRCITCCSRYPTIEKQLVYPIPRQHPDNQKKNRFLQAWHTLFPEIAGNRDNPVECQYLQVPCHHRSP